LFENHPMKKAAISITLFVSAIFFSQAQEVGYTTTDFGAEFSNYPGGNMFNFHLAFNAKLHHSIVLRAGYNAVNEKHSVALTNEKGGGFAGGLGYRYYFAYKPHQFFIGARADYWNFNISWSGTNSGGRYKASSIFAGAETGYMLLLNDRFFITPAVSLGMVSVSNSSAGPTRSGFTVLPGFSAGVKF
jgi:hypothetical protein